MGNEKAPSQDLGVALSGAKQLAKHKLEAWDKCCGTAARLLRREMRLNPAIDSLNHYQLKQVLVETAVTISRGYWRNCIPLMAIAWRIYRKGDNMEST
jgi:F0F1-type ATP synthase delta subunit